MTDAEALALAQDTIYQKQVWDSDPSRRSQAEATAAANRERLRANGFGWVSDLIDSNDTLASASGALGVIINALSGKHAAAPTNTGGAPGSTVGTSPYAPTANGNPKQSNYLGTSQAGSQGAIPMMGATFDENTFAGKIANGVTSAISGALNFTNKGIQAGAAGTGAAAGGLAQTVGTLGRVIAGVALPVLAVWAFMKVFKIKIGGGR